MTGDENPPKPFSQSIIEVVINLAQKWNISPFEILNKDIDDFILIINSLILENSQSANNNYTKVENNKAVTKNDGFWDM